ncbi:hypothetical protein [Saccharothrix obliqua]|uniref:hypothetical protein n=1 Tax=Saccharothrix obliqua TaxID=2861747 RepID=UPI001C6010EE|nr:hypothetical protein [Saccharothrix obliqua]MBW4721609.1 hypothetical protein [Saccharothrix obliqua]
MRPAVRSGKVWSLRRLLAEVDAGCRALWVRRHGRTFVEVPATVGPVDIAATAGWSRWVDHQDRGTEVVARPL